MKQTLFHDRRAVQIENERIRLTVTIHGGHVAELLEKSSGVNPLWVPPWPPQEVNGAAPIDPLFGNNCESRLLSGIIGHNLCLDTFGPPSPDEEAAGAVAHGEAGVVEWRFEETDCCLEGSCLLPDSQLSFRRRFHLEGNRVVVRETVENLSSVDRPIAWTQHVTIGPPFLENGSTEFRTTATRSCEPGSSAELEWPSRPQATCKEDLETYTSAESSAGYTAHLLDTSIREAWFFAWSPRTRVVIGYVWNRADFPWLGIWEENRSRTHTPWNGRTVTLGMEFGVSPFPETRCRMIERGRLFDTPCYRWIGARQRCEVEYYAAVGSAHAIPGTLRDFTRVIGHAD